MQHEHRTAPPQESGLRDSGLPKGSDEFVEAFARGLAVIKAFGQSQGALTISEVAQRARLTRAGARRLLHTLVTLGYARTNGQRFELMPKVLELGFAYLSSLSLRELARPAIDEFVRRTGELCAVSVLEGNEIVYIARPELRSPLRRSLGIGERLPVHATSTGHVLLGSLEPAALEALLSQAPFERFTRHTRCEADELRAAVDKARRNGWALAAEELELGVTGLAVPVKDSAGAIVAAVTLSVNSARHSRKELLSSFLPQLLEVAGQISRGLGALD